MGYLIPKLHVYLESIPKPLLCYRGISGDRLIQIPHSLAANVVVHEGIVNPFANERCPTFVQELSEDSLRTHLDGRLCDQDGCTRLVILPQAIGRMEKRLKQG